MIRDWYVTKSKVYSENYVPIQKLQVFKMWVIFSVHSKLTDKNKYKYNNSLCQNSIRFKL